MDCSGLKKCIYCGVNFITRSGNEDDHILPVQLGVFHDDKRFRRICPSCNSNIGHSEQQFLACGPESFFRRIVNPTIPKKRKRGNSYIGAMGAPCPESTIDHGDHRQLVMRDKDNPINVYPIDQIVIHDGAENEYFIKLFPGMKSGKIKEKLKFLGIKKIEKAWFHFNKIHRDEFEALMNATFLEFKKGKLASTEAGTISTNGQIIFKITDHYFRALTKIAFHYYLVNSRRGYNGDENHFDAIREFIMKGGNHEKFFNQPGAKFEMPFGDLSTGGVITPEQWCHVFSAFEERDYIVVYLQLFVGRGCVPLSHHIKLADIKESIIIPDAVWGHVYLYHNDQSCNRYAGIVKKANLTRLR